MDFAKLVSILNSASLHFARADRLGDPFEGSLTAPSLSALRAAFLSTGLSADVVDGTLPTYQQFARTMPTMVYVSCWHMNEHESAAMWQAYLRSGYGIAIRSTFRRLAESITDDRVVMIGEVRYINYDVDALPFGNALAPFVHKRISFSHERELRAVVVDFTPIQAESQVAMPLSLPIGISLGQLIEAIYVAPQSEPWFKDVVQATLRRFGLTVPVRQSGLDSDPVW